MSRMTNGVRCTSAVLLVALPAAAGASERVAVEHGTGLPAASVTSVARSSDGHDYAAAGGSVFTSLDGLRWTRLGAFPGFPPTIVSDPADPGSLFVWTGFASFASEDHGATFAASPVPTGISDTFPENGTVVVRPARLHAPRDLVVSGPFAFNGETVGSTDDGVSWTVRSHMSFESIAVGARRVLLGGISLAVGSVPAGESGELERSTDGGRTWKIVADRPATAIAVDPTHPSHVVAIGGATQPILVSDDDGRTWTDLPRRGLGAVVDDLAIDPVHSLTVWAASAQGLFVSRDGGARFERVLTTPGVAPVRVRLLSLRGPARRARSALSTARVIATSRDLGGSSGVAKVTVRSTRPVPLALPRIVAPHWRIGVLVRCLPGAWTAPARGIITWRRNGAPLPGHASVRRLTRADDRARLTCEQHAYGRTVASLPAGPPAVLSIVVGGEIRSGAIVRCIARITGRSWLVHDAIRIGDRTISGSTYTVRHADVGQILRCAISAVNRYGRATAFSRGHRIVS